MEPMWSGKDPSGFVFNRIQSASTALETASRLTSSKNSPASLRFDMVKSTYLEKSYPERLRSLRDVKDVSVPSYGDRVIEPLRISTSTRTMPLNEREQNLEMGAMVRQGRFGSLQTSWLVKNCFAAWRTSIHIKANFVLARDNEITIATNELDVIRELQIALAEKDGRILELEDKLQGSRRELVTCESRLRTEVAELENRNGMQLGELKEERLSLEEHWSVRFEEKQERLKRTEEDRDRRLRDAELQRSRLEEEWQRRLRHAEDLYEGLVEEHRVQIGHLEDTHSQRLRDAHSQRLRLEEDCEERLGEAQATRARSEEEFQVLLRDGGDKVLALEEDQRLHIARLQNEHNQVLSRLQEKHNLQVERLEDQIYDAEKQAALRLRESEERYGKLDGQWRERLRQAEEENARTKDHWSARLSDVQDTHGLHISRLEDEHGTMLRKAEDTRRALEEEWGLRLRSVQEDRDLAMQQMHEGREAKIKGFCSQAAMALIGSKSKGMATIILHAWARAAMTARLEAAYEAKLTSAEEHRAQLECEWSSKLEILEAGRARLDSDWQIKMRHTEEEREELLKAIQADKEYEKATRVNKVAMALVGGISRGLLKTTFIGWGRAVEHAALERELGARLREVEDHKAQLTRQHDSELSRLEQERDFMLKEHGAELRGLAEEESRKMQDMEVEFHQLQDTLDARIRQHESEKIALIKCNDDERGRLLKESRALAFMHKESFQGVDGAFSKTQERLVLLETFLAWSQFQTHRRWTRTVDDFYRATGEEADRLCSRRENAAELLALRHIARMSTYEVFNAWEQLTLAARWGVSMDVAERELKRQQRLQKTQAIMFVVSKGQSRLVLAQVLLGWRHCITMDADILRHEEEVARSRALEQQRAKAFGYKWAFQQLDATGKLLGQKILSTWWLLARESRWGDHLGAASGAVARLQSREDILTAKSLLRMEQNSAHKLAVILFAIWKHMAGAGKSMDDYRAAREKLLDRLGMKYGLSRGALFWQRIFAGWLRIAKVEVMRRSQDRRYLIKRELEGNALIRTTFLLQGVFARWKHWTANVRHQMALGELRQALFEQSYSGGRGRVLAVVSAIEDQRAQLAAWEAFTRWALVVRMARIPQPQTAPITTYYMNTYPQYMPMQTQTPSVIFRSSATPTMAPAPLQWRVVNSAVDGHSQQRSLQHAALPTATVGVDANHNGRPDYLYTGVDMNRDGIPDSLEGPRNGAPMATVSVDANNNGCADYLYTGVDLNRDGIPDVLQAGKEAVRVQTGKEAIMPTVRRQLQVPVHSLNPPALKVGGAYGSLVSTAPGPSQPSLTAVGSAASIGTLWETGTGMAEAPRAVISGAVSPRAVSPSPAYGSRLRTVPISAISTVEADHAKVMDEIERLKAGGEAPRTSWRGTSATAPVGPVVSLSPRRAHTLSASPSGQAFSEVIPPHAVVSGGGAIRAGSISPCHSQKWVGASGPPRSLSSSMRSVHRSVSPAKR